MADQKIEPGSIGDPAGPDMNKYYYRPGTTEPELRPEAVKTEPSTEPEIEQKPLKGKLPEDFPGYTALEAAGLTSYAKARKRLDALEEIDGIGPATAVKIREAMRESSEAEEEPE